MDNFNVLPNENEENQVNQEKPPPRMCPRCNSNYTKFCYYNNYKVSQPRYFCKTCRRFWTHGGSLRNIPIGGSFRKFKRAKVTRSSVSQMVSAEIRQYNQQPFLHVQENNNFVGSFGGSSSSSSGAVMNHFGSLSGIHNGTVENVSSLQNFRPIDSLDFLDELFELDNYNVGSIDSIGNPLINQSISGPVGNHNQVDQHKWNQSLKYNTMNMNDQNAGTSGSGGSASTCGSGGYDRSKNNYNYDYKIRNNSVIKYP